MDMIKWAENEVKLACDREKLNAKDDDFGYGCACYNSALKAFKCLVEDEHSRLSMSITKSILNRLIDRKPLTKILNCDFNDTDGSIIDETEDYKCYQCSRQSSLFKYVYIDGSVKYIDVDRVRCYSNDSDIPWSNGFFNNLIHDMYPITLPYIPEQTPYKVHARELLTDTKNGYYDTVHIEYVVKPNGEINYINRYFKESGNSFVEISKDEFNEREVLDSLRKVKHETD